MCSRIGTLWVMSVALVLQLGCLEDSATNDGETCQYHSDCDGLCLEGVCRDVSDEMPADETEGGNSDDVASDDSRDEDNRADESASNRDNRDTNAAGERGAADVNTTTEGSDAVGGMAGTSVVAETSDMAGASEMAGTSGTVDSSDGGDDADDRATDDEPMDIDALMSMPGGASLPAGVAACERGCLFARQCELDACYTDVYGGLISQCAQRCASGDRNAFAALDGGTCPDAGAQARNLLGIANECLGERSRCTQPNAESGTPECADGQACIDGVCGVFTCASDASDTSGNDFASAETLPAADSVLSDRTVCVTGDDVKDEDWYAISIPANQNLFIDIVFIHNIGDVDARMFESDGVTALINAASSSDNETLVVPAAREARNVLLQVFPFGATDSNQYDLHLNYDVPLTACNSDAQCSDGQACRANTCAPIPPCFTDEDCAGFNKKCEVESGICRECLATADCDGGICDAFECLQCIVDADCEMGRCQANVCIECLADADCTGGEICLGDVCASASCLDSLEPNNTAEMAQSINLDAQYDNLYMCGDRDFYTFTVPRGQVFTFNVTFLHEEGDIDVSLRQADGMWATDGLTTSDNEELVVPARVAGGEYIAEVRRIGSRDGAIDQIYSMFIDSNPPAGICLIDEDCPVGELCDDTENRCRPVGYCGTNTTCLQYARERCNEVGAPTDDAQCDLTKLRCNVAQNRCVECLSSEAPTTIEEPTQVPGSGLPPTQFNTCDGSDFFEVMGTPGKTITVSALFTHDQGDVDIKIYAPGNTEMPLQTEPTTTSTTDNEETSFEPEVAGPYIIEVYGWRGVYNEYILSIQLD